VRRAAPNASLRRYEPDQVLRVHLSGDPDHPKAAPRACKNGRRPL
jgi:hypothetical protein